MKLLTIILLIIALFAAGITWAAIDRDRGLKLINTAIGTVSHAQPIANIAYGDQPWQRLDVYPQEKAAPVLVFIHGGGWWHGNKAQYFFAADTFHRLGYTVVLPDYIKHPDQRAKFPSFIEDAALAIAWVKANIAQYQGDASNIFVAGHSAGAHTALMLATDKQYLQRAGLSPADLRGVAGIAGPYSFTPDSEAAMAVFGPSERYPLMDIFNYVDGDEPSTLLLHSKSDEQVGQYNQEGLAQRLQNAGVDVETVLYDDYSHVDIVLKLHPWFTRNQTVAADIHRFFSARLN